MCVCGNCGRWCVCNVCVCSLSYLKTHRAGVWTCAVWWAREIKVCVCVVHVRASSVDQKDI